jgi:hypothetical protein
VEGYRNYDKSEFSPACPLFEDDSQLEAVWKKEHSLQEFLAPSNFKSYDELKSKLHRVLGLDGITNSKSNDVPWGTDPAPTFKSAPAPKIQAAETEDDDDESMEFFKKLASG